VDVGTVIFSPNGRTVWHQHAHGQLLQITSGYGFVCREGGEPERVRAGDTVCDGGHEKVPVGGHENSPRTATRSPQVWPPNSPL
jgi:quercetin dioxygenase-like cupin family protein